MPAEDTISAIVTPLGEAGLGVVRISGREASKILKKISVRAKQVIQFPRTQTLVKIRNPKSGIILDQGLACFYQAPHSYTGEDVIELSMHGSPLVLTELQELICSLGARQALPGEFSKRAFINGKIDLNQAEAIIELINAKTKRQAENARQLIKGELSKNIQKVCEQVFKLHVAAEAFIEYPEEMADEPVVDFQKELEKIMVEIEQMLKTASEGKIIRDGFSIVITGKTNVGKSSLFNWLAEEERAIVTHLEGTTRDVLKEEINLGGYLIKIYDTAGIRRTKNIVEKIGIDRTQKAVEQADLILKMIDNEKDIKPEQNENELVIFNKIDLHPKTEQKNNNSLMYLSVKEKKGLDQLKEHIRKFILKNKYQIKYSFAINERQKQKLTEALVSLKNAQTGVRVKQPLDMISIDLKEAIQKLKEINGTAVSEEAISEIFSRFCVGK